jgi:hypothetical protein
VRHALERRVAPEAIALTLREDFGQLGRPQSALCEMALVDERAAIDGRPLHDLARHDAQRVQVVFCQVAGILICFE